MPRYQKGTLGKLVVQDWEIVTGYPDVPRLYILTEQQAAALIALASFLNWRTRWFNLPGDADIDAFASETIFNLMNPITCAMLKECLQPLFDDLRENIIQDLNFEQYGTENPTGEPLPEEAREENLAGETNPTCDLDILWAQCLQVVEYANMQITDALEIAESAANDLELVEVISSLPIIDESGVDAVVGYANALQEGLEENYEAQYTSTYRDEAACALFCLCKADCSITLERISQVFKTRIEAHFDDPFGALATISDLFFYFVDRDIDGTIIADFLHLIIWEGGILTNQFLGDVGMLSLEAILQLAANDASDDWLILCPDCPNEWDVAATDDPALGQFDTGFDVVMGVEYILTATGSWTLDGVTFTGPDGSGPAIAGFTMFPGISSSLIYKIGSEDWEFAGAEIMFTAPVSGRLYLAANDLIGSYGAPNAGTMSVILAET